MGNDMKRILLALAAALISTPAIAQTQFPPNTLWGNFTASTGFPATVTVPNCPSGALNFTAGTGFGCGAGGAAASGTLALATGAISPATCTSAQTASATGTLTTDVIIATFSADPTGATGYIPSTGGMLTIVFWPTVNTVNFKVCNNTALAITPGAVSINWRVIH
jgi:hypothetical protein